MKVKVCPKCGVENNPAFPVCRKCQASLKETPMVESKGPQQNEAGPAATQGYQQPQRPSPQPILVTPQPKFPTGIVVFLGLLVLATACVGGYFLYTSIPKPPPEPTVPADKVVISFLEAKKTRKLDKVKPYLCKESIEMIDSTFSGRQAQSAGFGTEDACKMYLWNVDPTTEDLQQGTLRKAAVIKDEKAEEYTTRVRATILIQSALLGSSEADFDFILVNEEGNWKVDLMRTMKDGTGGIALPL